MISALTQGPQMLLLPPCEEVGRCRVQGQNTGLHWTPDCWHLTLGSQSRAVRSNCLPLKPHAWRSRSPSGRRQMLSWPSLSPVLLPSPRPCVWGDLKATLPPPDRTAGLAHRALPEPQPAFLPFSPLLRQASPQDPGGLGARDPLVFQAESPLRRGRGLIISWTWRFPLGLTPAVLRDR